MIKLKSSTIDFECDERVVIWNGNDHLAFDSGTGKTHLFQTLQVEYSDGRLQSNKRLYFISDIRQLPDIQLASTDCILADELNLAPAMLDRVFQRVRDANAYLIAIGRLQISQFEYSVGAIYEFMFDNNHADFHQVFTPVLQQHESCDIVTCEDNTVVAGVYSGALEVDVKAAGGRSRFYKVIKDYKRPFLICDYPKFGNDLLNLIRMYHAKRVGKYEILIIFCPDCFEKIVYEAAILQNVNLQLPDRQYFFDSESYYENIAGMIPNWNKANIIRSITNLNKILDFDKTDTIRDLIAFYNGDSVMHATKCYVIEMSNPISIKLLQELADLPKTNDNSVFSVTEDACERPHSVSQSTSHQACESVKQLQVF